jgi:hypothetical protein
MKLSVIYSIAILLCTLFQDSIGQVTESSTCQVVQKSLFGNSTTRPDTLKKNQIRSTSLRAYKRTNGSKAINPSPILPDESLKCLEQWSDWEWAMAEYEFPVTVFNKPKKGRKTTPIITTRIKTQIFETVQPMQNGTIYSDCDNIPRFRPQKGLPITKFQTGNVTLIQTFENHQGIIQSSPNKPIQPKCRVDIKHCRTKFLMDCTKWDSAQGSWEYFNAELMNKTSYLNDKERCLALVKEVETYFGPDALCRRRGQQCEMFAGQEAVLIYWEEELKSRDICANDGRGYAETIHQSNNTTKRIHVTDAITFSGVDIYLRTVQWNGSSPSTFDRTWITPAVLKFSTPYTFSSPSVYVAHHPVTAVFPVYIPSESGEYVTRSTLSTVIGKLQIIEMRSDQLFSASADGLIGILESGGSWARAVANGKARGPDIAWGRKPYNPRDYVLGELAHSGASPFDYAHLPDPVPARQYFNVRPDCWGEQSHCRTIVDGTYRPKLAIPIPYLIPGAIRADGNGDLQDFFLGCGIMEFVDPPIALTRLSTTLEPATFTDGPTPGSIVSSPWASQTAEPMPKHPHAVEDLPFPGNHPVNIGSNNDESQTSEDNREQNGQIVKTATITSTLKSLPQDILGKLETRTIQLNKPAVTVGEMEVSLAPNSDYVVVSKSVYTILGPIVETRKTTTTMNDLPTQIISQVPGLKLQPGGSAVTVGDVEVSRAGNGDYILTSKSIYTISEPIVGTHKTTITMSTPPASLLDQISSLGLRPGGPAVTVGDIEVFQAPNGEYIITSKSVYTVEQTGAEGGNPSSVATLEGNPTELSGPASGPGRRKSDSAIVYPRFRSLIWLYIAWCLGMYL